MAREIKRSASAEFTELLQQGTAYMQRARSNVHFFDISPHLRRPHITGGYRTNHSICDCLQSLFQLHNETFNVWSHLIGCVIFLALLQVVASTSCDAENCPERWPLYVFVLTALWCLSASAAYHLIGTANDKWTYLTEKSDYVGIVALIVGSCAPVVWLGFGPAYAVTSLPSASPPSVSVSSSARSTPGSISGRSCQCYVHRAALCGRRPRPRHVRS